MNQPNGFFITGTCTDIGKTTIACGLLTKLNQQGLKTIGLKPLASGCQPSELGLRNEDALLLQKTASVKIPYEAVNPFAFAPPIAPNIAAQQLQIDLTVKKVFNEIHRVTDRYQHDVCIVEGCGGWDYPLNDQENISEIAMALKLPVILVVGMKLGCLNHTTLTCRALRQDGMQISGWVANQIDASMLAYEENINCLQHIIKAPLLAKVPYLNTVTYDQIANYFPHQYPVAQKVY